MMVESELLLAEGEIRRGCTPAARELLPRLAVVPSVDSTNRAIQQFAPPYVLLAEEQTGGRGRYGRDWASPFAAGIYLSLLLPHANFRAGLDGLSLAAGVIVLRALAELRLPLDLKLKWPNDLLASLRPLAKLGGILVETSADRVIIGLGINYYRRQTDIATLVTLEELAATELPHRNLLGSALINRFAAGLESFYEHGFAAFRAEWNSLSILNGLEVSVDNGKEVHKGLCQGTDAIGRLLLKPRSGELNKLSSGTIILPAAAN